MDNANASVPRVNSEQSDSEKKRNGQTDDSKSGKDKSDDESLKDLSSDDLKDDVSVDDDSESDDEDDEKDNNENALMSELKKGATMTAAAGVGSATLAMQAMMMLKMFMQMMMAMMQAALQAVTAFGTMIVNGIASVSSAIATALSISTAVATFGVTGVIAVAIVAAVSAGVAMNNDNNAIKDGVVEDCYVSVANTKKGEVVDVGAEQLANAQMVYSVFSTWGMDNIHIAGVLGNWQKESGIDPTTIECIYDEDYNIEGTKHQRAITDMNSYCINEVFPMYARNNISINKNGYKASDGKFYCGIGLGQYTGPHHVALVNYASASGFNWWQIEAQLIYCMSTGGYKADWLANWKSTTIETAEEAADQFANGWEGHDPEEDRQNYAKSWLVQMETWSADTEYANSLIAAAGQTSTLATNNAIGTASDNCTSVSKVYDNTSLATAAVSYAYETTSEGRGNRGTGLYQKVHDNVYPGDIYYMACDRSVACAVRWSGTDDTYPAGPVQTQLEYLVTNTDKWTEITDWGGDYHNLEAGDILIRKDNDVSHTVLYASNEVVGSIYNNKAGQEDYNVVSGSLNTRSPGCGKWYTGVTGLDTYRVFRNIKKESNSQYKYAGE